jgi:hypothetical protein
MALVDLHVFIRDINRKLLTEIDDYKKLTYRPSFNDVGTWILDLNLHAAKAPFLDPRAGGSNPGGGIIVVRNGSILFSGPIDYYQGKGSAEDQSSDDLVVSGFDDNAVLEQRTVWPVPANAFTAQGATAFYEISGASTKMETLMRSLVNVQTGPGARVERRTPGLVLLADSLRGTNTAYRGKFRFETVIQALREIAKAAPSGLSGPFGRGGLGFRVTQNMTGTALEFTVYDIANRINIAKFSPELGNLIEWDYSAQRPATTFLGLGAGRTAAFSNGPTVASNLYAYERTDLMFPSLRAEDFEDVGEVDPAATDAQAQLDERAESHYDSNAGQVGATFKLLDTESVKFYDHWRIGDYVSVRMPNLTLQEQVRSITLEYDADRNEQITATVGTEDGAYKRRTPGIYRRINGVSRKVAKLEVRQ